MVVDNLVMINNITVVMTSCGTCERMRSTDNHYCGLANGPNDINQLTIIHMQCPRVASPFNKFALGGELIRWNKAKRNEAWLETIDDDVDELTIAVYDMVVKKAIHHITSNDGTIETYFVNDPTLRQRNRAEARTG